MEEQIIKWIAQRIKDEHRKHAKNIDNWEQIAARKIVATYNVTLRQPDVIKSVCDVCDSTTDKPTYKLCDKHYSEYENFKQTVL